MSNYAELTDITDSAIRVNQDLLDRAEGMANSYIAAKGYDITLVTDSTPFLKELTLLVTGKIACFEQANSTESPLNEKYKVYVEEIDRLLLGISNQALGIDSTAPGGVFVALC
jgi:hypothetical protein